MTTKENSPKNVPHGASTLRCNLVCLGYSQEEADSPRSIPIVVVVTRPQANQVEWDVFVNPGWRQLVRPADRCYIEDLLEEWTETGSAQAGATVDALSKLSVGPLRTVESRDLFESEMEAVLQTLLGSSSVRLHRKNILS